MSAGDLLFERVARLTVAKPIEGSFSRFQSNAVEIENLRIQFRVAKTIEKEPNTAEITVTNMSERTRSELQSKGSRVILEAGYPTSIAQLFSGDSRTITHRHDGVEWSTVIHCGDGERAYRYARVNESFRAGTPVRVVAYRLAELLGLDRGEIEAQLSGVSAQYVSGYSARGQAALELDRVLRTAGYEWSIQDGRLQVLRANAAADETVEISPETGLIGTPEVGAPEKETGRPIVRFRALLTPRIRPGVRVSMKSSSHVGVLRVLRADHSGDTAGGDWYTDGEGDPQ